MGSTEKNPFLSGAFKHLVTLNNTNIPFGGAVRPISLVLESPNKFDGSHNYGVSVVSIIYIFMLLVAVCVKNMIDRSYGSRETHLG